MQHVVRMICIFVISVILMGARAHAACDLHPFLESLLYKQKQGRYEEFFIPKTVEPILLKPRSTWGASQEVWEQNKTFIGMNFLHSNHPFFKVFQNSLAEKEPALMNLLSDVERFQKSPDTFVHLFERLVGYHPKDYNFHKYYKSRLELLRSGKAEFNRLVEKIDPDLASKIRANQTRRNVGHTHDEQLENLVKQITTTSNIDEIMVSANKFNVIVSGDIAEMRAIASLPKVRDAGKTLGEIPEVQSAIKRSMGKVLGDIRDNPMKWNTWVDRYPKVFRNNLVRTSEPGSPGESLALIEQWIASKEIDVIRRSGDKTFLVEIKRSRWKMDEKTIMSHELHGGGTRADDRGVLRGPQPKSILDQSLETKEILKFLGLNDHVRQEFLATGGLTEQAKKLLEADEIAVIPVFEVKK